MIYGLLNLYLNILLAHNIISDNNNELDEWMLYYLKNVYIFKFTYHFGDEKRKQNASRWPGARALLFLHWLGIKSISKPFVGLNIYTEHKITYVFWNRWEFITVILSVKT